MADFKSPQPYVLNLRYIGFCGIDDSIEPGLLEILSLRYPFIEWGVLFRPDLEGSPRYASSAWLDRLHTIRNDNGTVMNFAAHLCQSRCQEVLNGNYEFITKIKNLGFKRVQINATKANGVHVDTNLLTYYLNNLRHAMVTFPDIEWILQKNTETFVLFQPLIEDPLPNMSVLFDASCGKGILVSDYPVPYSNSGILCGYAGGISPDNIENVLSNATQAAGNAPIWIDMESSLRVHVSEPKDGPLRDCFSIEKCFKCADFVDRLLKAQE